jgi:hypothetical protein
MRRNPAGFQFRQGARDLRRRHFRRFSFRSRFITPTFLRFSAVESCRTNPANKRLVASSIIAIR